MGIQIKLFIIVIVATIKRYNHSSQTMKLYEMTLYYITTKINELEETISCSINPYSFFIPY